ncbi:MAG TPA: DoxX family protein [Ktedonosporobacter sp.]|nr:DoxX family protein [Ktedonosporobacter sp.]
MATRTSRMSTILLKEDTRLQLKLIGYWATTALLLFVVGLGGVGELTHQWGTLETVQLVGYPVYFLTILGTWKILGTIALLVPRFPRLKEWAYAGIFFGMTGAAVSHAFSNNYGIYAYHIFFPLSFAVLALVSWALRPQSRTLGKLTDSIDSVLKRA